MFQFVMVLYGVPGFLYMFYFKNAKSNLDFVPKIVIWDQWTLRLSLFITFIVWGDRHIYVSVLCW